jgi:hypothetical protein
MRSLMSRLTRTALRMVLLTGAGAATAGDVAAAATVAAPAVAPYSSAATGGANEGEPMTRWSVLTQDITLARTLERWAAQAGYRLKWDAQRNFLIGAPDSYDGSFESALRAVLGSAGIRQSDYPLEACVYANTPPLVRVTRQGEQVRECDAP